MLMMRPYRGGGPLCLWVKLRYIVHIYTRTEGGDGAGSGHAGGGKVSSRSLWFIMHACF